MHKTTHQYRFLTFVFAAFVLAAGAYVGIADEEGPLKTMMESFLIMTVDGKETRKAADEAEPGSIVEYVITQHNHSEEPLRMISTLGPIPEGTVYVAESASITENITYSIDGGATFSKAPVMKTVVAEDGSETKEEAKPEEYTTLRWSTESLGADAKVDFTYRVRVQ